VPSDLRAESTRPLPAGQRASAAGSCVPGCARQSTGLADEGDLVQFYGEPGFRYWIEASTDLVEWTVLDELLNGDGILQYLDPDRDAYDLRFYRIEPVE